MRHPRRDLGPPVLTREYEALIGVCRAEPHALFELPHPVLLSECLGGRRNRPP